MQRFNDCFTIFQKQNKNSFHSIFYLERKKTMKSILYLLSFLLVGSLTLNAAPLTLEDQQKLQKRHHNHGNKQGLQKNKKEGKEGLQKSKGDKHGKKKKTPLKKNYDHTPPADSGSQEHREPELFIPVGPF
jgi:hypothetical protein